MAGSFVPTMRSVRSRAFLLLVLTALISASCSSTEVDTDLTIGRAGTPTLASLNDPDHCDVLREENRVFGDSGSLEMQIGVRSEPDPKSESTCSIGLGIDSTTGRAVVSLSQSHVVEGSGDVTELEALLADFSASRTVGHFDELCGGFIVAGNGRDEEGGWTSSLGALQAQDGSLVVVQADASPGGSPVTLTRYIRELLRMTARKAPRPNDSVEDFC